MIFLDEVACTGNETRLEDCSYPGDIGESDCLHFEDASILCRCEFTGLIYACVCMYPFVVEITDIVFITFCYYSWFILLCVGGCMVMFPLILIGLPLHHLHVVWCQVTLCQYLQETHQPPQSTKDSSISFSLLGFSLQLHLSC